MPLRLLCSLLIAFWPVVSYPQSGHYFLSNFAPTTDNVDHVSFAIAQSQNGVLYFATKNGVIEFDGKNWNLIPAPGAVFTVFTAGNEVFMAGVKGIGKLEWNKEKQRAYKSISTGHPEATSVFASVSLKDKAYFINERAVFVLSLTTFRIEKVIKPDPTQGSFTGLFQLAGNAYVNTENGLWKVENGKLVAATLLLPEKELIQFSTTFKGTDKTFLVGANNTLFLLNGQNNLTQLKPADATYLADNVMVNATWVTESIVAIGTLRGGVLFLNVATGATEEITNYDTGLPDNEVYAMYGDNQAGIWVAHDFGFTRISPFLPFRAYNHYTGLSGNLLSARSFHGQVYVGTTVGLYTLQKEEVFEEQVYYEAKQKIIPNKPKEAAQPEVPVKRKGFFSFLKKKKGSEAPTPANIVTGATNLNPSVLERKTKRVLKNLHYSYKKIAGIQGKVSQLMEVKGKLLAVGLAGMYDIEGSTAQVVLHDPVLAAALSPTLDLLIASTLNENIKTFSATKKGWEETHVFDTIRDYVSYIFEDKQENIWLCSREGAYKIETVDKAITDVSLVPLNNPALDETVGLAYGNEVYIAASGVFNRYDEIRNTLTRYDSLPGLKKYFASAGYFWFYDGHRWRTVNPKDEKAFKLQWLGLFNNIQSIAPIGNEDGLWIVTAANELYKFTSPSDMKETRGHPLFLREVRGDQKKIEPTKTLKISQLENTVEFEFIQPDYVGMQAVEYRYLIEGLSKGWSAWASSNNIINFSYLPVGNYNVQVQTRDLMGKVSNTEKIKLEIIPPYWKQTWFYAAEVLFFGSLVFLSMHLSKANSKYKLLSRLLSMLTIIMLIQLVDNIVASQISISNGPVVDFFIQVVIAMLMLPIEGFLRKIITKEEAKAS